MLYIVHHNEVVCAASEFFPFPPSRWTRGQILHFSATYSALPAEVDYAILAGFSGAAWHIEILAVASPRLPDAHSYAGVTVRILRKLQSDDETLQMISGYASGIARFGQTSDRFPERLPERRGAA
jgi:hypothetical protein